MRAPIRLAAGALAVMLALPVFATTVSAAVIENGAILVSDGLSGKVLEFTPTGSQIRALDSGQSESTGSAFDGNNNFYVSNFSSETVTRFDGSTGAAHSFGSGFDGSPESIVFNNAGNAYVGQAQGSHEVVELDPSGKVLNHFKPAVQDKGIDWIELSADQCTLLYTSEGTSVKSFDVCQNRQNPDFATGLPGTSAYELRIRPNGEVLVADSEHVVRLSSSGAMEQTYTVPEAGGQLFAMNLDPDGTSVWTADLASGGKVIKLDIASGKVLQEWSAGASVEPAGLAIQGEITVGGGSCVPLLSCLGGGAAALGAAGVAVVLFVGAAGMGGLRGAPAGLHVAPVPAGGFAPHQAVHHGALLSAATHGPAAVPLAHGAGPPHPPPLTPAQGAHPAVAHGVTPATAEAVTGAEGAAQVQEEAGGKILEVGGAGLEIAARPGAAAPQPPEMIPGQPGGPPSAAPAPPKLPSEQTPRTPETRPPGGARLSRDDEDEAEPGSP